MDVIIEILLANKFFVYVVWTSALFEKTLGLYLLAAGLWLSKKEGGALFYRTSMPIFYFLILNSVMIYDIHIREVRYKDFSYFLWFVFTGVLTYGVYKFIDKFQGRMNKKKKRVKKASV